MVLIGKEAEVTQISQFREVFGHFVVWTIFLILSEFRHDYRVVLFLSLFFRVTEWPCLTLVCCEMVYVQQESNVA